MVDLGSAGFWSAGSLNIFFILGAPLLNLSGGELARPQGGRMREGMVVAAGTGRAWCLCDT